MFFLALYSSLSRNWKLDSRRIDNDDDTCDVDSDDNNDDVETEIFGWDERSG